MAVLQKQQKLPTVQWPIDGNVHVGFGSPRWWKLGGGCPVSSTAHPVGSIPAVLEELDQDGLGGPIVLELREPGVLLPHLWGESTRYQ